MVELLYAILGAGVVHLDIGVPFRDLGPVEMTALAEKTLAQEAAPGTSTSCVSGPTTSTTTRIRSCSSSVTPAGAIIRAMAARLEAGGTIKPHTDALQSFARTHRIHIPLTSNSHVRFTVDGRPCPMKLGRGKESHISFILDYFPPSDARGA